MMKETHIIIDFDSTFSKVEGLDVLCEIVLDGSPAKATVLQQIKDITDKGMNGDIDFRTSLQARLQLLKAHRKDIELLAERLKGEISTSFLRNRDYILPYRDIVYIVSNGFKDFIVPVITHYGLRADLVYANEFLYDDDGYVVGFDTDIPLSKSGGKPIVIRDLNLNGDVYVIGDGYNDFEIKKAGYANKFYLFTENVMREKVKSSADHIAPNVDEILYELKMNRSVSYPKNRIKVLLLEGVHQDAVKLFESEGYQVEYLTTALSESELCERIADVNILGIRSKTKVTEKVVKSAKRLISVGAFCIGTNQIDLQACSQNGVAVFNAPYSNTRSVVELAIAEMVMLMRNLPDKVAAMHEGKWEKSSKHAYELRGKKLGIIGYGNIGAQLSVLAEAMGMEVYYFDLIERLALGNTKKCDTLNDLLAKSDIVSIHVDGRPENNHTFGETQFAQMKDGAIFLNLSRGKVVDIQALRAAILSGKIRGCAVDVFPKEPKNNDEPFDSALIGLPNTILTPHIGGSTMEAQVNIGNFVPNKIISYINTGSTYGSVNLPNLQLPAFEKAHRLLHIHHNVPNVLAQINNIMVKNHINILGQYLKTNETLGYVIIDIDRAYDDALLEELKDIAPTIWFRVLY
ncbi:MAG: phosphoglycerate dehydrogenase [Saprospiraceae bacterium]|nr:phosphoglycerate dehydrogenase [Saprospiraceae bacterium]